jgi:micrococcal nuclease
LGTVSQLGLVVQAAQNRVQYIHVLQTPHNQPACFCTHACGGCVYVAAPSTHCTRGRFCAVWCALKPAAAGFADIGHSSVAVGAEFSRVIRVVDGDTTVVDLRGVTTTVRLIGINTPETVDPRKPVQCFGKEASNEAKRILTGASVRVVQDPTQGAHDKYGRLLAYLFLPDGTLFNEHMVAAGFAYEYTYNAPYKYQLQFKADQAQAQKNGLGLWAPGVCSS